MVGTEERGMSEGKVLVLEGTQHSPAESEECLGADEMGASRLLENS